MPPPLCLAHLALGGLRASLVMMATMELGGLLRPYRVPEASRVILAMTGMMALGALGEHRGLLRPYRGRLVLGGSKAQQVTTATMATMGHGVHRVYQVMTATTRPYLDRLVLGGSKAQRVTTAMMATMGLGVHKVYRGLLRPCRGQQDDQVTTGMTRPYRGQLRLYLDPEGHRGLRVSRGKMVRQVLAVSRPRWPQIRAIKTPPTQRGAR